MGDHADDAINDAIAYEFAAQRFMDGDMDNDEAFDHDFIGPGSLNNPVLAKLEDEQMPMSYRTLNRELYVATLEFDAACRTVPEVREVRSVTNTPNFGNKAKHPECCECGEDMPMREGRYGMFYFCKNGCKEQKTISASDWKQESQPSCNYTRPGIFDMYVASCSDNDMNEYDIEGAFCQFCGKRIKMFTGGKRDE